MSQAIPLPILASFITWFLVAIKDSVKNIKISPDAQEALDEFGIELGVVDGDQPTQQKGSSAKPPTGTLDFLFSSDTVISPITHCNMNEIFI